MKKRTFNMDKEMFVEKSILLTKIKELSKYYNKKTIDMLVALVMLDESVFRHIDFGESFGSFDLFFEIAKYNICNRTIQTIDQINSIDLEKLDADFYDKKLSIRYKLEESKHFDVFDCNFTQQNSSSKIPMRPYIYLFEATIPINERIRNYESSISSFNGTKYRNNNQIQDSTTDDEEPSIFSVCGEPDAYSDYTDKNKIEELGKKVAQLKSYGELQSTVCNKVTDILLQDWNIEIGGDSLAYGAVKKLSWIDVHKKELK